MKYALIVALVLTLGLASLYLSLSAGQNHSTTPAKIASDQKAGQVNLISPRQFAQLATTTDAFVLDVHTPEQTHIPGTDAFIPFDQIQANLNQLPVDKTTPILVYCRSGSMSAQAARTISASGYSQVYDLAGGTNAYKEQQVSVMLWPANQDLGTVIYGDVATTSFTLTNYTPLPTKITRLSTSCGCTQATATNQELGPYDSTIIKVTFDPAVHKDNTDLGALTRTIYLETDNPNYPQLESTITATVVKN